MESRTKNVLRNIFWGFGEKIVILLLPFITRTIMIKVLGAEYLGLGSLLTSILTVLSLSELGFGSAIVFSMYKPIAEEDKDTICALLNLYRKFYRIVGAIVLSVGLLLMPFIKYLIKGDIPKEVNIYILYGVYLLNTGISYFMFAYKASLFAAHQRNDLTSKIAMIINIGSNLLQMMALLTIHSYYAYVIIIPIATIVTNVINGYLARKMYPEYECRGTLPKETLNDIKKRVIGLLSFKVYGVIFNSVDTITISSFVGLVPLAIYNNYYYIQTSILGFLNVITNSLTASVGNKMIVSSVDENYKDLNKFAFMNGWISCWCAICLLCLYQPFIKLWIGEEYLFPMPTMILMVLLFLIPRLGCLSFTYREAAGLWWQDRFRPIIATVVNLTINLSLVRSIGVNGVVLATLFCSVFINIPWGTIILFKNYFKRSPMEYLGKLILYFCVTCFVGMCTYIICDWLPDKNWLYLIFQAIICVFVPNTLFILFYHRLNEFEFAKEFIMRIVDRFFKFEGHEN